MALGREYDPRLRRRRTTTMYLISRPATSLRAFLPSASAMYSSDRVGLHWSTKIRSLAMRIAPVATDIRLTLADRP